MRDIGLRRGCIQTMQNDAHPVMSTSGMKGQSVLVVISHSGSNARQNFAASTGIKN